MKKVLYRDLGLIDYKQAWDLQENLFKEIVSQKIKYRQLAAGNEPDFSDLQIANHSRLKSGPQTPNHLLFCEHPHVYTLGKTGKEDHLLVNEKELMDNQANFYKINRGGDITYHGPGQLVGYPIFDLENFFTDVHKYMRYLEEAVILTLAEYGINGSRIEKLTGVWISGDQPEYARKICAFGVRISRWVTMHGFALNVNADLNYFKNIIPCGIADKKVTSMHAELGRPVDMNEVKSKMKFHLSQLFGFEYSTSAFENSES